MVLYKLTKRLLAILVIPSNVPVLVTPPLTSLIYSGLPKADNPVGSVPCLLGWVPMALPATAANVLIGV